MRIWKKDLYRYSGDYKLKSFLRYLLFTPGYRYIYLYRRMSGTTNPICRLFWLLLLKFHQILYAIQIPYQTKIREGFRILHFGNIVIHPNTQIGKNFNIANGVLIGEVRGKNRGVPIIGNNVYIGANAIVIGRIEIGNFVLIAPGAFVNFNVPDHSIVIGNPGRIVRKKNPSADYIIYQV